MGGASKSAKRGNEIAEASLKEQKRQYNAQRRREKAKEASAKANALGTRTSANMSYANTFNQSTDYGVGLDGSYSLLTAGGTPSVIGDMLSGANNKENTLG